MAVDPVCGMRIQPSDAAASVNFEGKNYYFCSEECFRKFMEDPEKYIEEGLADMTPQEGYGTPTPVRG